MSSQTSAENKPTIEQLVESGDFQLNYDDSIPLVSRAAGAGIDVSDPYTKYMLTQIPLTGVEVLGRFVCLKIRVRSIGIHELFRDMHKNRGCDGYANLSETVAFLQAYGGLCAFGKVACVSSGLYRMGNSGEEMSVFFSRAVDIDKGELEKLMTPRVSQTLGIGRRLSLGQIVLFKKGIRS